MKRLLLCGVCLLGCSTKRTEVVIGVATDLSAPGALDQVKLEIYRDNVIFADLPPWDIPGGAGDKFILPASFGVYADDGSEPRIDVLIHGLKNGQTIVTRRAIFSLVAENTLFLRMALVQRCVTRGDCPNQTDTCVEGKCKAAAVDAHTFPPYSDKLEEIVNCSSGTGFINTHTGSPLPVQGICASDEICIEGTCYKNPQSGMTPDGGLPTDPGWQPAPVPTTPPARKFESAPQAAADPQILMIWGGLDDSSQPVADTWGFDGNQWLQLANNIGAAGSDPTGPTTYDAARQVYFTFREPSGETWVFDGANWTMKAAAGQGPTPRTHSRAAFDGMHNQVVLFGGTDVSSGLSLNDTWLWDGTMWTQATPAMSPPVRHDGGLEFDASQGKVILFGGRDTMQLSDTWAWDGTTWTQVATMFPNTLIFNVGGQMVFDSTKNRLIWMNGTRETYTLTSGAWQQLLVDPNAPLLGPFSAAYFKPASTIISFGGTDTHGMVLAQTWVLNLP